MARTHPPRTLRDRLLELAPWLLVAALLHLAVLLALALWWPAPDSGQDAVVPVSIVTGPNPFVSADQPRASPRPAVPPRETAVSITPAASEPTAEPPSPPAEPPPTSEVAPPSPSVLPAENHRRPAALPDRDSAALLAAEGGKAAPGPFGNRRPGARGQALARYGGSPASESAVAAGLAWLAAHQDHDGSWDRLNFNQRCPPDDRCGGVAVRWTELDADPGVTALAVLAFLGAGSSHHSGEYRVVVRSALDYLLDRQRPGGSFSRPDRMEMYNDAMATLVLAECQALSPDEALRHPLRRAVDHLVRAQQPGGGWDYRSDLTTGRNDTSVTGWVVMALQAAASAGMEIPDRTVLGLIDHFVAATDAAGRVYYADTGTGTRTDPRGGVTRRYGPAMLAVGALSRQLLGWRPDTRALADQAELLITELPDVKLLQGGDPTGLHGYYYWYHATLALFLHGGSEWEVWNPPMLEAVLALQDHSVNGAGRPRHVRGSWPALGPGWGKWGRTGGRVYATALSVLTLETYYRYLPSYASARPLVRARTLRLALRERSGAARRRIVAAATRMPVEVCEPALAEALDLPETRTRLVAAIGLAALGNPLGKEVLQAHLPASVGREREAIEGALTRLGKMTWGPDYGRVIRVDQRNALVVFETDGREVYFGQRIETHRDGRCLAILRVIRRSGHQPFAVASFDAGATCEPGDNVHAAVPAD